MRDEMGELGGAKPPTQGEPVFAAFGPCPWASWAQRSAKTADGMRLSDGRLWCHIVYGKEIYAPKISAIVSGCERGDRGDLGLLAAAAVLMMIGRIQHGA